MEELKELGLKIVLGIIIITIFPSLIQLVFFDYETDSTEELNSIIENIIIPWWITPLEFLANIGGQIGTFFTALFLGFLFWIGEIRGN